MSDKTIKHFEVLARSHINGAIHDPGSIVAIEVGHDWTGGPNLREVVLSPEQLEAKHDAERAQLEQRHAQERSQSESLRPKPAPEPEDK